MDKQRFPFNMKYKYDSFYYYIFFASSVKGRFRLLQYSDKSI